MHTTPKVALVTGASSGFGQATAALLTAQGFLVFGTSRAPLHNEASSFELLPLDVRSETSVLTCVQTILGRTGRIDLLVNNAGFAKGGALEETSLEDAQAQFETNVLVEPTFFRTKFDAQPPATPLAAYESARQSMLQFVREAVEQGPDPEQVARRIVQLATSVGPRANLLVAMRHWLPQRIFEQVRRRVFQLERVPGFDGKAQPVRT